MNHSLDLRAYVLITAKPGTSEDVLKTLRKASQVEGVKFADSVYGRCDAIVVIEAPDMEKISHIVYKVIEAIPNVVHTETMLSIFP